MKISLLAVALLFALVGPPVAGQSPAESKKLNVAALVFDGVQIIDFTGPWEIFGDTRKYGGPAFRVFTVAEKPAPVTSFAGLRILPDYSLADAPRADVLLLPGGNVSGALNSPQTPFKCRLDDPVAHTTECALLPDCSASGYGLLLIDGTFLKFDVVGEEKAIATLKSTTKKNDLKARVTGIRSGDTLKVETLVLQ